MNNVFEFPNQEFVDRIRAELRDYFGADYSPNIISFSGKTWFIKSRPDDPESKNRELLAFLLGESWLNIPEVRLLSSEEFQDLHQKVSCLDEKASEQNTCLVRLVQDYEITELPIQDFEEAIASEIAFSSWIWRRDPHSANRAFVQGIPMFFDFHNAFGFGGKVEDFFREGSTGGYVRNWRLWQIKSDDTLSAISLLRHLEFEEKIAVLPVIDMSHLEDDLFRFSEYIRNFDQCEIYKIIKKARFSEKSCFDVNLFLQKSSGDLNTNIDRILSIISKDKVCIFDEKYLKNELIKYYSKYKDANLLADQRSKDLEAANFSIAVLSNEIDNIQQSAVWQILMSFHYSFIERMLPHGSKLREWYDNSIWDFRKLINKKIKM
jgi:hypothetical protein